MNTANEPENYPFNRTEKICQHLKIFNLCPKLKIFSTRGQKCIFKLKWMSWKFWLCLKLFTNTMMTSSNGNFFRVTGPLCGDAELWCFLLSKRLSKQSWGWWFETPSRPLWRHCNDIIYLKFGDLLIIPWTPSCWMKYVIIRLLNYVDVNFIGICVCSFKIICISLKSRRISSHEHEQTNVHKSPSGTQWRMCMHHNIANNF